jgi:hypothetical protein
MSRRKGVSLRIGALFRAATKRNNFLQSPFCAVHRQAGMSVPFEKGTENTMVDKSSSAGARHGSNAKSTAERTDTDPKSASGLNERTGEFRVGEKIIFGMRNGNVLIRHSPQGDEVEVSEATLAGLMADAFFNGKLGDKYPPVEDR